MVSDAGLWIGWFGFVPWPDGLLRLIADFSFAYTQEKLMRTSKFNAWSNSGMGYHSIEIHNYYNMLQDPGLGSSLTSHFGLYTLVHY